MEYSSRFKTNLAKLPEIQMKKRLLSNRSLHKREPDFIPPKKNLSQISRISKNPTSRLKALDILHSARIQARDISHQKIINIQNRIHLIKDLQEKYQIQFTQSEIRLLSNETLEMKAKFRCKNQLKVKAYNKIAYWWKRIYIIKKIKAQFELAKNAAVKIQTWWRLILLRKSGKAEIKNLTLKILKSVNKIQAVFRGYLIRKSIGIQLKKKKINKNFEYFFEMKQKVMTEVLKNIVEIWSDYRVRDNYLKLFRRTKETERKSIFSLLKRKSLSKNVYNGIKEIINKHLVSENKHKKSSVPGSPLEFIGRQRSGTEDFILN